MRRQSAATTALLSARKRRYIRKRFVRAKAVQIYTRSKPGRPGLTRSNPVKNRVWTTRRPALDRVVESGFSNCFGVSSYRQIEFSGSPQNLSGFGFLIRLSCRENLTGWGSRPTTVHTVYNQFLIFGRFWCVLTSGFHFFVPEGRPTIAQ